MAILSKIRERGVFLIVVVGLALFAFVLDPTTLQDFFNSSKVNEVGEVNGESITRQEYAAALESYRASNQRATDMQAASVVWNNLLRKKIFGKQLDDAGITIGENDLWENIVNQPFVQQNPEFFNEVGLFDEDRFKTFLLDLQAAEDQSTWNAWNTYMNELSVNLLRDSYYNLVNAGLGASLKEGKYQYEEDNTFINADFVYIPFTSIPDSLVTVTKSDIESYVNKRSNEYQVDATRDISLVKFTVVASEADKLAIKNSVIETLEDRTDDRGITTTGFKNTTDYNEFFDENESDIPYREVYRMKDQLPTVITQELLASSEGDIVGPYEEGNFFKLSKITEIIKRPDSVKSSYILIPYKGATRADASITRTEEQAKKIADSVIKLVRRNKKKFAELAGVYNNDGSKDKGGDLGWTKFSNAFSPRFDRGFAEFIFGKKVGEVGIVQTQFGYHIIRVDEQKNVQNAYNIVTYGKQILPSEETGNAVFQQTEQFILDLSKDGKTFYEVAKDKGYQSFPAIGLKVLDERVPRLQGTNRPVIQWAFNKETNVGDYQRFDISDGHIVVLLTAKNPEGTMSAAKASGSVRPIVMNQKKAELIKAKMTGASLEEIAKANNTSVRKINGLSIKSPSIPGVGNDKKAAGAMMFSAIDQLYNQVEGLRGVFAFVVTQRDEPAVLTNYEPNRQQLLRDNGNSNLKIFEALKEISKVNDDRAFYHGVNE